MKDRAQAHTLEGVLGAILIVSAVTLGLQAVDTGPFTGGVDRQPDLLETQAEDVLALGHETGALGEVVRCYGQSKQVIDGDVSPTEQSAFERMLNQTFDRQGDNYELYFSYWNKSGGRTEELVSSNESALSAAPQPSASAVTLQTTLYDDMPIQIAGAGADCETSGPAISRVDYFIPDVNEESVVYNVVEVRLVVW